MPLGKKRIHLLTGFALIVATIATRIPFATKFLYEFDSINFSVATFRFSIEQVTPHFPGYILHILFAKVLLLCTNDINQAFVWISILLSIGSVLYLWRAGAALRGERVGIIVAMIWLFLPIFWFYGLVATVYEYEAFFASALLYHGIKIIKDPTNRGQLIALFVLLSLATAARQSSFLFFAPAIIFLCISTRQSIKNIGIATILFAIISALWLGILFFMCGGASEYFGAMRSEHIYRSQSILFGNSLREHLSVIAKIFLYLGIAAGPFVVVFVFALIRFTKRTLIFFRSILRSVSFRFASLAALAPLVFYVLIYFMKAGYLLNILPFLAISTAVLIDQLAIWHAYDCKIKAGNNQKLTRPIITKRASYITAAIVGISILWFVLPFPSTSDSDFNNSFTHDSFGESHSTLALSQNASYYVLNRFFSFTSLWSADATDKLHEKVFSALASEQATSNDLVLIDTWWHRWGFYYLPDAVIYDVRDLSAQDTIAVGRSQHYLRTMALANDIIIPKHGKVLLLLRRDHPAFAAISKQIRLERLPLPEYLDIWRVADSLFVLKWKNRTFIRQ